MMTKNIGNQRDQLEMLTIDQLVPEDHLVRKLDAAIDFSFIYPLVEDLYSSTGRPSIDPVVLIKMTFLQYTFGICSMRQTIKEIETNMAYRWFLGFGFQIHLKRKNTRRSKSRRRIPRAVIKQKPVPKTIRTIKIIHEICKMNPHSCV